MVIGVCTTHADELIPGDTQFGRIAAHILTEEPLVEIVMSGRHRGMNGIKRRSTYELHSLVEGQSLLDIIAQALQVTERSMTLVAVINVFLDAEFLQ